MRRAESSQSNSTRKGEWNSCFIKSNQEILLDLVHFSLQEPLQDNLMVAFPRAWYNGSHTHIMAAKSIEDITRRREDLNLKRQYFTNDRSE